MKSMILTGLLFAGLFCSVQAQHVATVDIDFKTTDNVKNDKSLVQIQLLTALNVLVASNPAVATIPAAVPLSPAVAPAAATLKPFSWVPLKLDLDQHPTTLSDLKNAKLNFVLYPVDGLQKWTFDFDVRVKFDDNTTRIYNFYGAKLSPDSRTYSVSLP